MNQEQMIDVMKNGLWMDSYQKAYYVSFGQWSPEMQELAREIGYDEFNYQQSDGTFAANAIPLKKNITYRLRSDYELPKPEPEFEYVEIRKEKSLAYTGRFFDEVLNGLNLAHAEKFVGFAGYCSVIDQKPIFQQHFTPDMKFVVLRREIK